MKCSGCRLEIALGDAGCQALFEELTAREFMGYRYGRFHRPAVDAYCLQHPDRYCKSGKSLMAHLGGLACAFVSNAYAALQRSLNGKVGSFGMAGAFRTTSCRAGPDGEGSVLAEVVPPPGRHVL
jgi:hypothetical protein